MDFSKSVEYLLSLGNEVSAMKLGLENIRTLLAELGDPHEKYLKVQVAGTNGKGSVCAFLDSICKRANVRTGTFTSPHLVSITERVRINGVDTSESEFARIANVVRVASETLLSQNRLEYRSTFFEQMTAIALLAFANAKVEVAILETGLGGRLDATTAAKAEIAAITRIDLDHQEYLGNTIEEIAAEKAAIIRRDSNVVLTHQSRAVEQVLIGRCRELGIDPIWAGNNFTVKRDPEIAPLLCGTFQSSRANYPKIDLNEMLGAHQFENASVAIAVAELLQEQGLEITNFDIRIGLETATHPGRLEYNGHYLLDGAHNPAGAKALRDFIDEFEKDRPITIVFGAMSEKDVAEMAAALFPRAEWLVLTKPSNSRAMSAVELTSQVPEDLLPKNVIVADSVEDALAQAEACTPDGGIILVTGSLYLVGEVKKLLQDKAKAKI
jgi:dihydrofolate synthase/folylpolyglutamate synthase